MDRRDCLGWLAGAMAAGVSAGFRRESFAQTADAPRLDAPGGGVLARGAPPIGAGVDLPSARLLDGRELPASHWKDKVVVIELWATWCPFCARQNPHLDTLHRAYRDRGLEVIALSIDRDPEVARRYVGERDYAFHAAMFDERWQAAIGRPKGLPIVWVVGRDSKLARLEIGELFPEDIAEFSRLL
jgi:thiol-disulfide isomerase/thioredoxin